MGTKYIDYDVLVNWALLPQQQVHRMDIEGVTYIWRDGIVTALFAASKLDSENYPYLISYLDNGRANHGLGKQLELMPPDVPFEKRGVYYMIVEMPTAQAIFDAVEKISIPGNLAQPSYSKPEEAVYHNVAYNAIVQQLYPGIGQSTLDEAVSKYIHDQVTPAMTNVGWTYKERRAAFVRELPFNRTEHTTMDKYFDGERYSDKYFFYYVALDAYDREYHIPERYYPDDFRAYVEEMADRYGYVRKDSYFQAKPVALPDDIKEFGDDLFSAAGLLKTSKIGYQCIPITAVRAALINAGINLTTDQIKEQLLGRQGEWRAALILNGFHVNPKSVYLDDYPGYNNEDEGYRFYALVKRRRLGGDDADRKIAFASGFPVMVAGIAIDSTSGELVFLDMVGSKNAITANWAALVQHNRFFSYSQTRFKVGSAQNHTFYQQPLPSGLYQMIVISNYGLPKYLDPTVDVGYILTNKLDDMPEHFFATLDKMLEIPIVPTWAEYLWVTGRVTGLIDYAGDPNKQVGITAWKIRGGSNWNELVSTAINSKSISFT